MVRISVFGKSLFKDSAAPVWYEHDIINAKLDAQWVKPYDGLFS